MRTLIITYLLILSTTSFAQTPEVRAKAAFLKAQELYGSADYQGAIEKLEQVQQLLGGSNPRVDYLLAQCHFQTQNISQADAAIASYFKLGSDDDPNYMAMLGLLEEVDAVRAEYNKIQAEKERMEAAWEQAIALNTLEGFNDFIRRYPSSVYIKDAQAKMNKFPAPQLYDERDDNSYNTIWVNGKLWMAEDLRYSPLAKLDKKTGTYSYTRNNALNACPSGWRLPSYDMVVNMVQAKIPSAQEVPKDGLWDKERLVTLIDKSQISMFIASGWMITGLDEYRLNFNKGRLSYFQIWTQEGAFRINQSASDIAIVIENYEYPKYAVSAFPVGGCRCVKD